MSRLIDATETYLRTILELEEEGVAPMRARIAERLHQSCPTVSQTAARMERDGLLHVASDRHLELTEEGRRTDPKIMHTLRHAGVQPGGVVSVTSSPGGVMVASGGLAAELPTQTASHVFVAKH